MNSKIRLGWLCVSLITALAFTALVVRITQAEHPADVQAGTAVREVVVALPYEPNTLYVYGEGTLDAIAVCNALMDGPFVTLDYAPQATILTRVPGLDTGDEVIEVVTAISGSQVVADDGEVVALAPGVVVRPAGCRSSTCAITFDGSPLQMDRVVTTFTLRSGVRWSDGVTLTTQDAVFGQQIACDQDTPTSQYVCDRTAAYAAADSLVTVWTGLPGYVSADAPLNFWTPLPYHVLSTTTASELLSGDYGRQPLGWGPFKLTEWVTGSHITLEHNPYYWRPGYPKLDRVTFRFMSDSERIYAAMLRGEVQLAVQSTFVASDHVTDLRDPDVRRMAHLLWTPSSVWEHMDFGILPADGRYVFFDDPQVRRAVAYAIDRQRLIDELLYGLGAVPNAYIPPEHPLYTTTLTTYPYSPTQAAALLTAAGWVDTDDDGIRDKGGHAFVVTYTTTSSDQRMQAAALIKEDLDAVGIRVNLDFQSSQPFFDDGPDGTVFGRKFDLATFAWLSLVKPQCDVYLSSEIPAEANQWAGRNDMGYSNPAYDAACELALASLPGTSDYVQGHQAALQIFADDLPALPLFYRLKMAAVSAAFSVEPDLDPIESLETWNIWAWDITSEVTADLGTETFLVAPNSIVSGTFPAGSFTDTTVLTWVNRLPLSTPQDLGDVGRFFSLEAQAQTSRLLPVEPQQPYTLAVTYAQAALPGNVDENTLKLYYWAGEAWEVEPTSHVDVVANIVTATPDHLATWAVLGDRTQYTIFLPLVLRGD